MDGLRAYIDKVVQGRDDADGSTNLDAYLCLSLSDKRPVRECVGDHANCFSFVVCDFSSAVFLSIFLQMTPPSCQ